MARALKNFGFRELILVKPRCEHLHEDAKARAMHGFDLLRKAKVVGTLEEALAEVDVAVATSAKTEDNMQILRSPLPVREFVERHAASDSVYGFVFGPERIGLTNEQLKQCDLTVQIPAHHVYPTLNLSHAVAIVLYETRQAKKKPKGRHLNQGLKRELIRRYVELVHCGEKIRNKDYALAVFKALLTRTPLQDKEGRVLLGLFDSVLKRVGVYDRAKEPLAAASTRKD